MTQDEQQVPDDGTGHGGFHQFIQTMIEGNGSKNDLGQVTESGIEETADPGTHVRGQLFRSRADEAGEHHHSQAGTGKQGDIIFQGGDVVDQKGYGDENDEIVDAGFEDLFHIHLPNGFD